MAIPKGLQPASNLPTDRASYFTWEDAQPTRTEFLAGTLLGKPDVQREESLVTGNLLAKLHQHLRGSAFQTYGVQMKLEVDSADAVFYPDVMVSCDAADRRADLALRAPCLLVEVLSDSTAAFDRGAKFAVYPEL